VRSPSHVAAAGAAVLELAAGGLRVLPEVRGNHRLAGRPELRLQLRLLPEVAAMTPPTPIAPPPAPVATPLPRYETRRVVS